MSHTFQRDPDHARAHEHERAIVWVDPSAKGHPWLREGVIALRHRARSFGRLCGRRLVAYSTLKPDAPSSWGRWSGRSVWIRRVWVVGRNDSLYRAESCPIEGVLTESIVAGQPSLPAWPILQRRHRELQTGAESAAETQPGDGQRRET